MRLLIAIAAMLMSGVVQAVGTTATVEIIPVTQYTDDTAIPATDILKYTVKWQGGSLDVMSPQACPNNPQRICVNVPVPCGDRVFTATVTPKATAKYPTVSDNSNDFPYSSGVVCRPKAPTISSVQ